MLQKVLDAKEELILLSRTRKIQESDLVHPVWQVLAKNYEDVDANGYDTHLRAIVSLTNAALTHNKVAFAITRNNWQEIVRKDPNYNTEQGKAFGSNLYKSIVALAVKSELFEVLVPGKGRTPMGMVFCYEPIIKHMTVNYEEQINELKVFLEKKGCEIKSEIPTLKSNKKVNDENNFTFIQVLNNMYPREDGVRFDMLEDILATAVKNNCNLDQAPKELIDHFFNYRKKPSPKMKKFAKDIEVSFERFIEEHEASKLDIKKPEKKEPKDPLDEHCDTRIRFIINRAKARKAKVKK